MPKQFVPFGSLEYIFETITQMFFILALLVFTASAAPCPTSEICSDFAYKKDDLGVCSSRDIAQIWNTTSGECYVHMDADLRTVSYMSQIFTLGVTLAVRYQIGEDCWHYIPENVAVAIVQNSEYFNDDSVCDSHPYNSPSLGWEMRYVMETKGYADCASLVVLHDDYLVSCVRYFADARALATLAYMLIIAIGIFLVVCLPCCFCCNCLDF